ncbi:unnamed protein product [Brassicogethes aeneus]|uniref:ARID domain-containing protein n=1 Tax=Brassicogethes aeneus TaxID=1431903 RepID=A0A9P0FF11_BRAAE|nr:unnamed protein product [Brassicogethes aeneus]
MNKLQVDDPPYLAVGTAVSAKYKGAFCEAKVHKLVRCVKCKVTFKTGLGTVTVTDNDIKGTLRVGQVVQVKHPVNAKDYVEATITKMQDCSQYTVVFDDGDITTLRRTALCLKSGRHFNESSRRGRRNRQLKEDSSEGEPEEENEPDLEGYSIDIGRVRMYEQTDKKRIKDSWFPGLVVIPSSTSTTGKINVKEEYLIRSFKDGRYYTVPKKETRDFNGESEIKHDSSAILTEAVNKALKYLDHNELPVHWERSSLFNSQNIDSDSEDNISDSSDDEPSEEKDLFVAQLYKFLDDSATPLNKTPSIHGRDIDLHRLFRIVHKLGGYNKVNNKTKWKAVTMGLKLPCNQNIFNQVKSTYKKCLLSYENFNRALGVTMLNHTRSTKKNSGRSLIRDRDRGTPVNSPKPEKEEELEKKEEVVVKPPPEVSKPPPEPTITKSKRKLEEKKKKEKEILEVSDTTSSGEATDQSESVCSTSKETRRPKRFEPKLKEKKGRPAQGEKVKALVEKFEEVTKKDEDKVQQTRSKSITKIKEPPATLEKKEKVEKEKPSKEKDKKDKEEKEKEKDKEKEKEVAPKTPKAKKLEKIEKEKEKEKEKPPEEEKKKGRKRTTDEKPSGSDSEPVITVNIGDKLKVYYGPTHESKVTYEAKVIQVGKDQTGTIFLVHYTGWNTRYDEWITTARIAENLSSSKAKRLKHASAKNSSGPSSATPSKGAAKRGRGQSISGKNAEVPRSTTPSSVTSSGSRTKSPATPATRSTSRVQAKYDYSRRSRRTSAQTDISIQSESESEQSDSESEELTRTRSGGSKTEEPEIKTYKRKPRGPPPSIKAEKRSKEKEDDDTEKEEDPVEKVQKRTRKIKKSPEKSADESDDDSGNPPKGRDFDLNQIRSELKGFSKAVPASDLSEKEAVSSSDDSTNLPPEKITVEVIEEKLQKPEKCEKAEKSPIKPQVIEKVSESSDDIYEFKEPEPYEFERSKLTDERNTKKRLGVVSRLFEELEKSPKKKIGAKSPTKSETKESSPEVEKKKYSRSPVKKQEETTPPPQEKGEKKSEDPFDTLVQSPSFNFVKTSDKQPPEKSSVARTILGSVGDLFNDLNDPVDDYSAGMELSDGETQMHNIFSRSTNIFPDTFAKGAPPPEVTQVQKIEESKQKDSDDDEIISAQVRLLMAQTSSTDDDSNEPLLITPSVSNYQKKKDVVEVIKPQVLPQVEHEKQKDETEESEPEHREPSPMELETDVMEDKPIVEKSVFVPISSNKPPRQIQISPALKETDSALLESIVNSAALVTAKIDEAKEFSVKKTSGSKIADSILQKFQSIKKMEGKSPKRDFHAEEGSSKKDQTSVKEEVKPKVIELKQKPTCDIKLEDIKIVKPLSEVKPKPMLECKSAWSMVENKPKKEELVKPVVEVPVQQPLKVKVEEKKAISPPHKHEGKRKKVKSKQYIDDSDTDSSDSEQLVIARSDEDSQSNSLDAISKIYKESDSLSNQIPTTDDSQSQSQSQSQEERNFKFDDLKPPEVIKPKVEVLKEEVVKDEPEVKEEEPDSNFHSLLLCEETIPRSPAPAPEPAIIEEEEKPTKSILEMPFASAPGMSSSSKSTAIVVELPPGKSASPPKPQPAAVVVPLDLVAAAAQVRDNRGPDASAVLDNTPPTTPESTISNLSPRGENGGLSPSAADDSCKSNDIENDYQLHRRNSTNKVTPYSEEDTQMTIDAGTSKKDASQTPGSAKKRRRSCRAEDVPTKRGRKPSNRVRQNSDSDDTSEHSTTGSTNVGTYDIAERGPRPTKYNFIVELDSSLDSTQRIAVLQQQMSDLKKTYADIKAELAVVERRRKKIRRREREALKASKQEASCT